MKPYTPYTRMIINAMICTWSQSIFLFSPFFFFFLFYAVLCYSSFYFPLYVVYVDRRGASESHVKKENRRLCCRAKNYENLFLSIQTILLGEIVTHEALPDYSVWFLVIYLFIWDCEANIFYIFLPFLFFENTLLENTIFFFALLSIYHSCLWYVFD